MVKATFPNNVHLWANDDACMYFEREECDLPVAQNSALICSIIWIEHRSKHLLFIFVQRYIRILVCINLYCCTILNSFKDVI